MLSKLIMYYLHRVFHPVPATFYAMKGGQIKNILRKTGARDIFMGDSKYQIPRHEDIVKFLKINIFKFRKYSGERYDCDDYAFSLKGLFTNLMSGYAIGIVWVDTKVGKHALNFYIGLKKGKPEMFFIEPQTNQIFQNDDYKPYFVVM